MGLCARSIAASLGASIMRSQESFRTTMTDPVNLLGADDPGLTKSVNEELSMFDE